MYAAVPIESGKQWLKVDVINDAYSRLRISGLTADPTPRDLEVALMRLETMAAGWRTRVDINYNFEDEPDPNSPSNIPSEYFDAFSTNLAVRLIPDFNKQVPQILYNQSVSEYSNMSARFAANRARGVQYPSRMPRGSGNTLRWNRWSKFYRDSEVLPTANRVKQIFIGDTLDQTIHYDSYLDDFEIIESYDLIVDDNLTVLDESNTDNDVYFRIQANNASSADNAYQTQVTLVVTTDLGRVNTRKFYYQVVSRG